MQLEIGQIFNDRFKILGEIGRGGFSRVLLVSDTQNGNKEVALKLFADTTGLDTQTINEVKAEFNKVRGKSHPNILAPYEFGQIENVPYLVMDYADGGNLRHKFGEILPWSEEEKLSMIKQVLSGLSYLHENSIIHHDLKPENIVIHNGEYKIIDFGLSEKTKSSIKSSVKTASKNKKERITVKQNADTTENVSSGYTEQYVSPEKVYRPLRVSSKSDIFSLGIILFEMFEGVSPWNGQGGVVYGKTEKLPEFDNKDKYSSKTYKLIKSCLALKPEQRPTAKEILDILEKPEPKRTWIYGLVGMIAAIAVTLGIYFGVDWNDSPNDEVVINQDTAGEIEVINRITDSIRLEENIIQNTSVVEILRSEPMIILNHDSLTDALIARGCYLHFNRNGRIGNGFENVYETILTEKNEKCILDKSSNLIWQQSGSSKPIKYNEANPYVIELNDSNFGGYNDWRLPTVDEISTLLEPPNNKLSYPHIDPIFDKKQYGFWTSDKYSNKPERVWIATKEYVGVEFTYAKYFVRAVRSVSK